MQYNSGDVLFDFFFRDEHGLSWSTATGEICLNVGASGEANNDFALAVTTSHVVSTDCILCVASDITVLSDAVYDIKAISVSPLCLAIEEQLWSDSQLSLRLSADNATGDQQVLFNVREDDWFTN